MDDKIMFPEVAINLRKTDSESSTFGTNILQPLIVTNKVQILKLGLVARTRRKIASTQLSFHTVFVHLSRVLSHSRWFSFFLPSLSFRSPYPPSLSFYPFPLSPLYTICFHYLPSISFFSFWYLLYPLYISFRSQYLPSIYFFQFQDLPSTYFFPFPVSSLFIFLSVPSIFPLYLSFHSQYLPSISFFPFPVSSSISFFPFPLSPL